MEAKVNSEQAKAATNFDGLLCQNGCYQNNRLVGS